MSELYLGVERQSTKAVTPPSCYLCRCDNPREVWQISGLELRKLFDALGARLSEEALRVVPTDFVIRRFQCSACGFDYFDPNLTGTGQFYSELEATQYYPPSRPEFERAWALLKRERLATVLDVGCGDGCFLDGVKRLGGVSIGLELNPTAAAAALRKGHRIVQKPFELVQANDLGGKVDLLTFFQVLEHVPKPVELLEHAHALVKPGGLVMVSVPSKEGIRKVVPLDPANMPPHHLSHWRRQDLRTLSVKSGLECVELGRDVLYGTMIEEFVRLQNKLARAIGRAETFGGDGLAKVLAFVYRKAGLRHLQIPWGLSVWALLRIPLDHGR